VQDAQPGTRVVQLGSEQQLLASVGRSSLDAAALRAVKKTHDVDALIVGHVDFERAKPTADATVALSARIVETHSGATVWADATKLTSTAAPRDISRTGHAAAIEQLAHDMAEAFRDRYVTRQVPNDHPAYADIRE
jgi:hypothetical protein